MVSAVGIRALFWPACLLLAPMHLLAETETGNPYYTRPGTEILVSNLPPPRDQGELAFCYAAVPAILLDRHRCQRSGQDCTRLTTSDQVSMLDIASENDGDGPTLHEFGSIVRVFRGLIQRAGNGTLQIARESCMPYSALDRLDMPDRPAHLHLRAGWNALRNLYNSNQLGKDQRAVPAVREALASQLRLPAPPGQQLAALRSVRASQPITFEQFAWQLLSNPDCRGTADPITIPPFRARAWPTEEKKISSAMLQKKIRSLLERDLPVSLSYCARWEQSGGSQKCWNRAGHASIVVGQREVCHRGNGDCQMLYKLLNSFGSEWNASELLVWVPADALLAAALELQRVAHLLVWLE